MAFLGMNVSRTGNHDPAVLAEAGVRLVRLVAMADVDLTNYIQRCQAVGIGVLLVIARESLKNDTLSFEEAAQFYGARYDGLVGHLQVGNEPDGHPPSSWTMTMGSLNRLLVAFRTAFPQTFLVGPGLSSGNPANAAGMDVTLMDAVAVHPYGQGVPGFASPYGFPGHVGNLIHNYEVSFGKPIWVTEWGVHRPDFEPNGEATVLEYMSRMLTYLRGREDIFGAIYFCWTDAMVPGFGLLQANGTPHPGLEVFRQASQLEQPLRRAAALPSSGQRPWDRLPTEAESDATPQRRASRRG